MSLFQSWEYGAEDLNDNQIEEPGKFGLIDGIISCILTIVNSLFGYFPSGAHPHIPRNSTDVYPDQHEAYWQQHN